MDGWNNSKVYTALEVCEKIYELQYELQNCVRGCYTGCYTYEELGKYIRELAERLQSAGEDTEYESEDPEEDEYDE